MGKLVSVLSVSAAAIALAACGQALEIDSDGAARRADASADRVDAEAGAVDSGDASDASDAGDAGDAGDADDVADVADAGDAADAERVGPMPVECERGTADCNGRAEDGCEVSLSSAIEHCGRCANACVSGPHSSATCSAGACGLACERGFADCDGDPRNGCEVDLNSDAAHCGRCANACRGGANASPVCAGGLCGISCSAGFSDCDATLANGCEVNLSSAVEHCGACGNRCTAPAGGSPTCAGGACDFTCDAGLLRCGSACVRRDDPAYGCGTCTRCALAANATAMACGGGGSVCVPSSCAAGYKLCGDRCVADNDPAFGCQPWTCSSCVLAPGASSMMCAGSSCAVARCSAGNKLCGSSCVATTDPRYGCGAAACGACAPQNAAATCNGAGACDYSTCNAGWRDLDGIRSNGCETAAPSTIGGLRVWLSVSEPGSLATAPCAGRTDSCLVRWNNLADATNPSNPWGSAPVVVFPRGDGTAAAVAINGLPVYANPSTISRYVWDRAVNRQATIGLGALVNSSYTVFVADTPQTQTRSYPVACRPSSIFDTNGAFHLGNELETQLRLGHYNNDLNVSVVSSGAVPRVLMAMQSGTGRTLTRTTAAGTNTGTDSNFGLISHSNDCTIGLGLTNGAEYAGLVQEVLVYSRSLSLAEQNVVMTYLRRRNRI
jgi:hypothetical protein